MPYVVDLEKDRDLEVHYADADGSIVGANEAVEDFTARTLDIHFAGEAWGCNVRIVQSRRRAAHICTYRKRTVLAMR